MSSCAPFAPTPFDTSAPPEASSKPTSQSFHQDYFTPRNQSLASLFLRPTTSEAARERILASVNAYQGPSGAAPFTEPTGASEDEIDAAHRAWAIVGRVDRDVDEVDQGECGGL